MSVDLSKVHATTVEAAAWFGVKTATIRKWVYRGKIKPSGNRRGMNTYRMSELVEVDQALRASKAGRPRKSQSATCT